MFLVIPYPSVHERLFTTTPSMYRLTPPFLDGGCSWNHHEYANGPSFPSQF